MNHIQVDKLFTLEEVQRAVALWRESPRGDFNMRATLEIIAPALPRINKATGQQNDVRYLAYILEYLVSRLVK